MCVMVENAGFGAVRAAPIARDILDAYFHPDTFLNSKKSDSTKTDSSRVARKSDSVVTPAKQTAVAPKRTAPSPGAALKPRQRR
jgi:hypothetical protein